MTTIKTLEQAETLPAGAIIRTARGVVAEHTHPDSLGSWLVAGFFGRHRLYDSDLPAVALHDPGSVRETATEPHSTLSAPAGVTHRETIARSLHAVDAEHEFLGDDSQAWDDCNQGYYLRRADAVLAVLPTRTVAQVKAEAWDEGATAASPHGGAYLRSILIGNPYRADELEREDKR